MKISHIQNTFREFVDLENKAHRLKWKRVGHVTRIERQTWENIFSEWTVREHKEIRGRQVGG